MTDPDPDLLHITQTAWVIWRDLQRASPRDREWHWVIAPSTLTLFKRWAEPNIGAFEPDPQQLGRFTLFGVPIRTDPETDHEIELRIWK